MSINITIKELRKSFRLLLINIKAQRKLKTPQQLKYTRINICNKCEYLKKDSHFLFFRANKCSICTCYIKAKTALIFEYCPKGRW